MKRPEQEFAFDPSWFVATDTPEAGATAAPTLPASEPELEFDPSWFSAPEPQSFMERVILRGVGAASKFIQSEASPFRPMAQMASFSSKVSVDAMDHEDGALGYAADTGRAYMAGAARTVESAGWLVENGLLSGLNPALRGGIAKALGQQMRRVGRESSDWWLDGISEGYERAMSAGVGDDDFGVTTIVAGAAMSLNETMLTMGAGAAAGKLTALASRVGLQPVIRAAEAGSRRAQRLLKYAKHAPAAGGIAGSGLSEGMLAAGASGVAVEETIMGMDHEELLVGSDRYFEIYDAAEGMSEADRREYAKATLAEEAARDTATRVGVSTSMLGAPMGVVAGRLGGAAARRVGKGDLPTRLESRFLTQAGVGLVGEAGQEFVQEGAQQLLENLGIRAYADSSQDPWEGVLDNAIMGGLIGGLMGGTMTPALGTPARRAARADMERRAHRKALGLPEDPSDLSDGSESPPPGGHRNPVLESRIAEQINALREAGVSRVEFQKIARWAGREGFSGISGGRTALEFSKALEHLIETGKAPENVEAETGGHYTPGGLLNQRAYEADREALAFDVELHFKPTEEQVRPVMEALAEDGATPYVLDDGTMVVPQSLAGADSLQAFGQSLSRRTGVEVTLKRNTREDSEAAASEDPAPESASQDAGPEAAPDPEAVAGADPAPDGAVPEAAEGVEPAQSPPTSRRVNVIAEAASGMAGVEVKPDATVVVEPGADGGLDAAGLGAATHPESGYKPPTDAQIKAGNYAKGKVLLKGTTPATDVRVTIENVPGSIRKSLEGAPRKWSRKVRHHYGYLPGTKSSDGDAVDVYLGRNSHDPELPVFVIRQMNPDTGLYDEPKVIMGYASEGEARAAYLSEYPRDLHDALFGGITRLSREQLAEWVKSGETDVPPDPISKRPMTELRADVPRGTSVEQAGEPAPSRAGPGQIDFGDMTYDDIEAAYAEVLDDRGRQASEGGRVIDVDLIREISEEYRANRALSPAIHAAASAASEVLYNRRLARPVAEGRDPAVLFTAGGGGSGKSFAREALLGEDNADIVMDGTLSDLETAERRVQAALDSGRQVDIVYVYRSPEKSAEGAIQRAVRMGRPVPVTVLAEAHANAPKVIEALQEKYADNANVTITKIWNDGSTNEIREVSGAEAIPDVQREVAEAAFRSALESAYRAGSIGADLYRAFAGREVRGDAAQGDRQDAGDAAGRSAADGGRRQHPAEGRLKRREDSAEHDDPVQDPGRDGALSLSRRQTRTPAFRRWFGDSKVVDADGNPQVVYHGTGATFTEFNTDDGTGGSVGAYFSEERSVASYYAERLGGQVLPVYLSLQNPLILPSSEFPNIGSGHVTADERAQLEAAGYDGIIGRQMGWLEYVAFRPEQIKSATGNRGTFDPLSRDILLSLRRGLRPLIGMPTEIKVDGVTRTFGPHKRAHEAAARYMRRTGRKYAPPVRYVKADPERGKRIAEAYEKMEHAPGAPMVRQAYRAMIDETRAQFEAMMQTGLQVEFNPEGTDPYGNPRNAILDVVENNHLYIFPTVEGFGSSDLDVSDNPLLEDTGLRWGGKPVLANDLFRAVHDYFGHVMSGVGFRASGEENAWRAHASMYSPLARWAMTSETRGQNSWVNFGPHAEHNRTASGADTIYADQKVGLLPLWIVEEGRSDAESVPLPVRRTRGPARTVFEVAPHPSSDQAEAWNSLPLARRIASSRAVLQEMIPSLRDAGVPAAEVSDTIGGYGEDVNPSHAVEMSQMTDREARMAAASAVGRSLGQESVILIEPEGDSEVGVVAIDFESPLTTEVAERVYTTLRSRIGPEISGFTSIGNTMEFMNFSDVETDVLAELVAAALGDVGGKKNVYAESVNATFIEESEYDNHLQGAPEAQLQAASSARDRHSAAVQKQVEASAEEGSEARLSLARRQTRTPAFRRWFGDSKVVDADGNPMVVYHGSPDARFVDESGTFMSMSDRFGAQEGVGEFWFAADMSTAKTYATDVRALDYQNAEPAVIPVYLSIQNPMVIDAKGKKWGEVHRISSTRTVIDEAKELGHDGVIIRNVRDHYNNWDSPPTTTTYTVFNSRQIKSATSNTGAFDPANADIRLSKAPRQNAKSMPARKEIMPGLYSALYEALQTERGIPKVSSPKQWKQWLDGAQRRGLFRAEEREWADIDAYLDSRQEQAGNVRTSWTVIDRRTGDALSSSPDQSRAERALQELMLDEPGSDLVIRKNEHDPGKVRLEDLLEQVDQSYPQIEEVILEEGSVDLQEARDEIEEAARDDYMNSRETAFYGNHEEVTVYKVGDEEFDSYEDAIYWANEDGVEVEEVVRYRAVVVSDYDTEVLEDQLYDTEEEAHEAADEAAQDRDADDAEAGFSDWFAGLDDSDLIQIARDNGIETSRFAEVQYPEWSAPGGVRYREVLYRIDQNGYVSSHFDGLGEDLLMHSRVKDRQIIENGSPVKIYSLEEIQSDLHQDARERGYESEIESREAEGKAAADRNAEIEEEIGRLIGVTVTPDMLRSGVAVNSILNLVPRWSADVRAEATRALLDGDTEAKATALAREHVANQKKAEFKYKKNSAIQDAPFKRSWQEVLLKNALRDAAINGYDALVWTTGIQQVERYGVGVSQVVDTIEWVPSSGVEEEIKTLESITSEVVETKQPINVGHLQYRHDTGELYSVQNVDKKIQLDLPPFPETQGNPTFAKVLREWAESPHMSGQTFDWIRNRALEESRNRSYTTEGQQYELTDADHEFFARYEEWATQAMREIVARMDELAPSIYQIADHYGDGETRVHPPFFSSRHQASEAIERVGIGRATKINQLRRAEGEVVGLKGKKEVFRYTIDRDGKTIELVNGEVRTLKDLIGGDLVAEIAAAPGESHSFTSTRVVGGKGQILQYDQIMPKLAQRLVKRFGLKVRKTDATGFPTSTPGGVEGWRVDITPELRDFLTGGMPAYSLSKTAREEARKSDDRLKRARAAADAIGRNLRGAPPYTVVSNDRGMPSHLLDQIKSMGVEGMVEGLFDPASGRVYIISDNVSPRPGESYGEAVERVFVEEVLGHHGLRATFGPAAMNALFDQVWRDMHDSPRMIEIVDEYAEAYGDPYRDKSAARKMADELLSKSDPNEEPGLWSMMVAWLREQLRKVGVVRRWTDNDLKNLMERVHDNVRMGLVPSSFAKLSSAMVSHNPDRTETTAHAKGRSVVYFGDRRTISGAGYSADVLDGYDGAHPAGELSAFTGTPSGLKALGRYLAAEGKDRLVTPIGMVSSAVAARSGVPYADSDGIRTFDLTGLPPERDASFSLRNRRRGSDDVEAILKHVLAPPNSELSFGQKMSKMVGELTGYFGDSDTWLELKTGWIDSAAAIEKLERDQFDGSLLDAADSAYKMVNLTRNLPQVVGAVAKYGVPQYREGSFVRVDGRRGLYDIFAPLTQTEDGKNQLYLWEGYAVARRSAQLINEQNPDGTSKEKRLTQDQIDRLLALEDEFPHFRTVFDGWQQFNRELLDLAVERGAMSAETAELWKKNDYVPFYRVDEEEDVAGGIKRHRGVSGQRGFSGQRVTSKRLTGSDRRIQPVLENIMMNTASVLEKVYKNEAMNRIVALADGIAMEKVPMRMEPVKLSNADIARQLVKAGLFVGDDSNSSPEQRRASRSLRDANIDLAIRAVEQMSPEQREQWTTFFRPARPEGNDIVSTMVAGKPVYYRVTDPLLLRAIQDITPTSFGGLINLMGGAKNVLTTMVTLDPGFMLANWMRDSMSAWATLSDSPNPITALSATTEIWREDGLVADLAMAGGSVGGFYNVTQDFSDVLRRVKSNGVSVLETPRQLFDAYRKIGMASEQVNRVGVARQVLARGGSLAEAAYQAQDLLNFSQSGDAVAAQVLIRTVPFLNARIQGLYRLYKGAAGLDAENRLRSSAAFFLRSLIMAGLSMLLALRNAEDERYEKIPEDQKDGYWHFFVGDMHFALPKPFEIGVLSATVPERIMRLARGMDSGREFAASMARALGETFAFNPIPQLFKPVVEQWANRTFYGDRPIVGLGMDGLEPQAQYNPWTSESARLIADTIDQVVPDSVSRYLPESIRSPARIEHLVRSYFGSVGAYMLSLSDAAVRGSGLYSEAPAWRDLRDMPGIGGAFGRFYRGSDPELSRSKYQDDLYDALNRADDAYRTFNAYIRQGQINRAEDLLGRRLDELQVRSALHTFRTEAGKLNAAQRQVMDSDMSPEEKRRTLDDISRAKSRLMAQSVPFLELVE